MPRQIIDTETSRPAYQRRRAATFIVIALAVLALAAGGWLLWDRYVGAHAPAAPTIQGNSVH